MKALKLIGSDGTRFYSWELKPGQYSIGRDTVRRKNECDFCIMNSTVSRRHALLEVTDDYHCFLTDLGSHNGTTVNSAALTERTEIKQGDALMFGETEFKIADKDEVGPKTTRRVTTQLALKDPEKSVFLSINEALQPLPSKVAELPEVLGTLMDMAKTLALHEPREIMLQHSLSLVAKAIPAERLAILTTSDDGQEVYIAASHLPEGKEPGSLTLSRTIINNILTNKNAILIQDAQEDPDFASQKSIIMSALKSAMAVPLFDEGKVLGVLYVDSTNPMHRYNNDFLRLLATFGNIIASRLVNYALLDERAEKQLYEAELDRASLIQKKLLDIKSPEIEGYQIHALQEQCRAVGGDLYDLSELNDGRFLFMVADVSGKGMGAALLMANILASFRILYHQSSFSLIQIVEQISTHLYRYSAPEDFATLFVGTVNRSNNEVQYVNAGHNPALVIRADGTHESLESSGVMIGAFEKMNWQEESVTMGRGDLLCVYSDGVTEAECGETQYGDERLLKNLKKNRHLGGIDIARALVDDIEEFVGDSPQSDDITLMVIRRND